MIDNIHAVITWVDGDDPVHREKRMKYVAPGSKISQRADVGGDTRFSSVGELYWCIRSIQKFAPFISKIFIVTDSQDPKVKEHIPELTIPVEIVDHKVIFRGYEQYLPIFSSRAIETMIWRIPGLSENFVSLNDDFFITAPVTPDLWFDENDHPVVYGKYYNVIKARIARQLNYLIKGRKVTKFRDGMLKAALLPDVDAKKFVRIHHLPRPLKKSLYEEYFTAHPEEMINNITARFRDISQYNSMELVYLLAIKKWGLKPVPAHPLLVTMGPSGDYKFRRRYRRLTTSPIVRFLCANSMDLIRDDQRTLIIDFLNKTLK